MKLWDLEGISLTHARLLSKTEFTSTVEEIVQAPDFSMDSQGPMKLWRSILPARGDSVPGSFSDTSTESAISRVPRGLWRLPLETPEAGLGQMRLFDQSVHDPIRRRPNSVQRLNEGIRRIQTTTSPETGQRRRPKELLWWVSFSMPWVQPAMEPENRVNSSRETQTAISRVFRLGF